MYKKAIKNQKIFPNQNLSTKQYLTLYNKKLKREDKQNLKHMNKLVRYFSIDGEPMNISEEDIREFKPLMEEIPAIKVTKYKIDEQTKSYFKPYTEEKFVEEKIEEILFFNNLSSEKINEDIVKKIMEKRGNSKIIPKDLFPKKNSAEYIGIILS